MGKSSSKGEIMEAVNLEDVVPQEPANNHNFKKGKYVVCKYQGKNGDVIVGSVESVRSNGHVLLKDLLTGGTRTKRIDVLTSRNRVVPKRLALSIVEEYQASEKTSADKALARKKAADLAKQHKTVQLELVTNNEPVQLVTCYDPVDSIVQQYKLLTIQQKIDCSRLLWGDVLKLLQVGLHE